MALENQEKAAELATRTQLSSADNEDLLKKIAADIGAEVAAYIQRMYPEAVQASSSTFLLSLRNFTHNQIVSAVRDEKWIGDHRDGTLRRASSPDEWLRWRKHTRALLMRLWRKTAAVPAQKKESH